MSITEVTTTPLSIIDTKGGAVLHAIKGWKRHKKMVLNLIVPIGSVRFILYDDRKNQNKKFHLLIQSLY